MPAILMPSFFQQFRTPHIRSVTFLKGFFIHINGSKETHKLLQLGPPDQLSLTACATAAILVFASEYRINTMTKAPSKVTVVLMKCSIICLGD